MSQQALRMQRKDTRKKHRYVAGCTGKKRYHDLEEAKDHIRSIKYRKVVGRFDAISDRMPCRGYYCANCKGFHLTSQPEISMTLEEVSE